MGNVNKKSKLSEKSSLFNEIMLVLVLVRGPKSLGLQPK